MVDEGGRGDRQGRRQQRKLQGGSRFARKNHARRADGRALFEQNRAHLVGAFPMLEDQPATFSAGLSDSPDRLDAMVWGLTELALNARRGEFVFGGLERPSELDYARRAILRN
jgi:hypothetical protein